MIENQMLKGVTFGDPKSFDDDWSNRTGNYAKREGNPMPKHTVHRLPTQELTKFPNFDSITLQYGMYTYKSREPWGGFLHTKDKRCISLPYRKTAEKLIQTAVDWLAKNEVRISSCT